VPGRSIDPTITRMPPKYTGPDYVGDRDAIWIAMITSKARISCDEKQKKQLSESLLYVTEDFSPKGFIATGNREPVRLAIARVLGKAWVEANDWDDTIPGQRT
jgi:hypothetical protein